ncbi:hypothetical protein R6Q57_013084 [Mikania cordata]
MEPEIPHRDDVAMPLDAETLAMSLGVLADVGEAERARAILGQDTPLTRLFDITELPTYRLITVEFLSTFRYRAHQAAVREQEDEELRPDIEFSLCGQHMDMSIERCAVHLGIYYEPETVRDAFTQGLTQGEDGVMRAWWAQIYDTPFTGHRLRATTIRDPLICYIHRCIVTTISGRRQSQEWVTTTDLFYLHSLMTGRPCNLAWCFALYYSSFYHRQECGTLWGGAFVTHSAHTRGMVDLLQDLPTIEPRKLDRRTLLNMRLAADIQDLGLRFVGSDGRPFQAAQLAVIQEQQPEDQAMPEPDPIREEPFRSPAREDSLPHHPPHVYRAVHLNESLEALLHHVAARCDEMAQADRRRAAWEIRVERRLDRLKDLVQWTVASEHA